MVPYQVYHMYSASVEKKLLYDGSEAVEKKWNYIKWEWAS